MKILVVYNKLFVFFFNKKYKCILNINCYDGMEIEWELEIFWFS